MRRAGVWAMAAVLGAGVTACSPDPVDDDDRATVAADVRYLVDGQARRLSISEHWTVLADGWVSCGGPEGGDHGEAYTYLLDVRPSPAGAHPEGVTAEHYLRDLARAG